jgi:hypothetical protein
MNVILAKNGLSHPPIFVISREVASDRAQCHPFVRATGAGVQLGLDVPLIPSQPYLEGQQGSLDSVRMYADPTDLPLMLVVWALVTVLLFSVLNNLFFGIALWRSGTLPQGAAILWVGAAVLGVASLNPSV